MTRPDDFTNTEHQAGIADRLTVHDVDDRDHDDPSEVCEWNHSHGPGMVCLKCVLDKAIAGQAAEPELMCCDVCTGLYDPTDADACGHGRWICAQCVTECRDCRDERREDARAQTAMDIAREAWGTA